MARLKFAGDVGSKRHSRGPMMVVGRMVGVCAVIVGRVAAIAVLVVWWEQDGGYQRDGGLDGGVGYIVAAEVGYQGL